MKSGRISALASALLLLAACRSDPISFHTLTPAQPAGPASSAVSEIQIESLSVPPQVDRPQIVIRQGASGLAILETQWWAASLSEELRSALNDQLNNVRADGKVLLRVEVQRFDSIPGQYALIDANWRLRGADGSRSLNCRSILQTASGISIEDLVAAQQNNVKRLATLVGRTASSSSNGCPTAQ
ncbi:PqiC family protein [Pseudomonas fluorescens]